MSNESETPAPRHMPGADQLLTVDDVAHRLQRPATQVREWLRSGCLRGKKMGKSWRITWAAVDDFIGSWK
jgi:excisionase family DNA binding protein